MSNEKYELLKDTPNAKAGDIYEWDLEEGAYYRKGVKYHGYFIKDEVENNPDWFRKIEQREWEILSFVNDNGNLFTLQKDGKYSLPDDRISFALYEMLSPLSGYTPKIHSIKRLKDDTVFTIGDYVDFDNARGLVKSFEIFLIELTDNVVFLTGGDKSMNLKYATKRELGAIYTEKQLLEAEEKAFEAAREIDGSVDQYLQDIIIGNIKHFGKYSTFSKYKNKS